jgi:hypothetical protein
MRTSSGFRNKKGVEILAHGTVVSASGTKTKELPILEEGEMIEMLA